MTSDRFISIHELHDKSNLLELRGISNLLKLTSPETYGCELIEYQRSLRVLTIKVYDKHHISDFFLFKMMNVFYFSGPVFWDSANFYLSTAEENLTFLRTFPDYNSYTDDLLKDLYFLINIKDSPVAVRISATNFGIVIQNYTPQFDVSG